MGLSRQLELKRYLQVRLLDVENGFPGVEALVNKCIKVLAKGQLGENSLELSRHAVEFDLVVLGEVSFTPIQLPLYQVDIWETINGPHQIQNGELTKGRCEGDKSQNLGGVV